MPTSTSKPGGAPAPEAASGPGAAPGPGGAIKARALELGFDVAGIAPPKIESRNVDRLRAFLDAGHHGTMGWMAPRADERAEPNRLWPEVKSIIMVGHNYGPDHDPLDDLLRKDRGVISVYARGKDYHDLLKKRLKTLARWIVETQGGELKVFVDTAPVMEKPLAAAAGIGWQGKHTNLVSGTHGSWLFLGAIYTTLKLAPDDPHEDHCGSCHACIDICPTNAFPAPYQLDARRCISYLTIEHKDHIPPEFRGAMGNHIYGCDDCLGVCPWNKFAQVARESAYHARLELKAPELKDLVALDDAAFREVFSGSPVKRTGRDRFVRNVLIAMGNSGDGAHVPRLRERLDDVSPLVRAMAIWALARLLSDQEFEGLRAENAPKEQDPDVATEWQRP